MKVLIAPQLCCNPIDTKNKTNEWWDAYFSETEKFLLHFASLAQKAEADAFMYAIGSWEIQDSTVDINKKWSDIWKNIRKEFSGEIGEMVWVLGPEVSQEPQSIPSPEYITWSDQLDFILVATEFPLSEKDNPTNEELEKRAGGVLDGIKKFYDESGLPVILRNGYFNVKYSWKGQSFYQINSVPWIGDPESKLKESVYEFNTEDHARVVNAYFKAIADRPWVIGYLHFGYTHWEDPLSAWMSVRGKPAEDIWSKWNKKIYSTPEKTQEKEPTEVKPVLKNLGLSIEPWNKKTNKAGDFLFENKNYVDNKIFTEFGHKIVNDMGEKLLPEIGFNVPVGTKVVSPIDGIITDLKLYEPSQDYIIFMGTDETSPWIVGFEHVYNLRVKVGDKVLAGQELAEVSPSYGRTEYGNVEINVWTTGQSIIKYCPFNFLDESLKPVYEEKLNKLASDWEEFIGKDVYKQEDWVAPGCLVESLKET